MKLKDLVTLEELTLPNDLLWEDEFNWSPVQATNTYTLTGALVIEVGTRLAGRPFSLKAPENEMAWVTRATVQTLRNWSAIAGRRFQLSFEQPDDHRQFTVVFDHSSDPIGAEPVRGFPYPQAQEEFRVNLKFIEVPNA